MVYNPGYITKTNLRHQLVQLMQLSAEPMNSPIFFARRWRLYTIAVLVGVLDLRGGVFPALPGWGRALPLKRHNQKSKNARFKNNIMIYDKIRK